MLPQYATPYFFTIGKCFFYFDRLHIIDYFIFLYEGKDFPNDHPVLFEQLDTNGQIVKSP